MKAAEADIAGKGDNSVQEAVGGSPSTMTDGLEERNLTAQGSEEVRIQRKQVFETGEVHKDWA